MIAVDSNILVYAQREDSQWHRNALAAIRALAEGAASWAIPWPCLYEYFAIVTHPKIYNPPTPAADALKQISYWQESPGLVLLGETENFYPTLEEIVSRSAVVGAAIHDARIASLCLYHGVKTLYTADRDFSRFPNLKVQNPLM